MDEQYKNLPKTPQEANMADIHRRYWLALLIIVIIVGVFSFQSPVKMERALHIQENMTPMTYAVLEVEGDAGASGEFIAVPENVQTMIAEATCSHILQEDAEIGAGDIVVYPDEDSDYAVVFFEDGTGYVYCISAQKLRYSIKDGDGALWAAVEEMAK